MRTLVYHNNYLYQFGGNSGGGVSEGVLNTKNRTCSTKIFKTDIDRGTCYTLDVQLPIPLLQPAVTVYNNNIYLFGGFYYFQFHLCYFIVLSNYTIILEILIYVLL